MPSLNFPTATTVGEQYLDWVWNGVGWDAAPSLPGGLPAGSIIQWGGAAAPVNWLLCDGSAVSRTTYASLFAAVGTSYGTGDGSTTFNLPDLRGRVPVGKNGGSFGTLGATGGAETVTLTEAQMPSHTHIQNAHNHSTPMQMASWPQNENSYEHINGDWGSWGWPRVYAINSVNNATATNQYTGGGQAHNNLQPYQVVNYIIKATAAVTPGESELAGRTGALEAADVSINSQLASILAEMNKVSFAQVNKTTLQAFGSGFMTIQFNEILFAKNIQLIGNLIRFTHPGVYKISVGMRIANDAGDSWTGMSLYNATAGRVGISYGTGNVAGDPGPMEFTFLANVTNTSVDYAIQLYRASSVLTQLTPDTNAGKAIAATIERVGAI